MIAMSWRESMSVRRSRRRRLAAVTLAALMLLLWPAAAAADFDDWCPDDSPPPVDFGLHRTGGKSYSAPPYWLHSVTGGEALLEAYLINGVIDIAQLQALTGGVANGMAHATAHR